MLHFKSTEASFLAEGHSPGAAVARAAGRPAAAAGALGAPGHRRAAAVAPGGAGAARGPRLLRQPHARRGGPAEEGPGGEADATHGQKLQVQGYNIYIIYYKYYNK